MMPGEESHPSVFSLVKSAFTELRKINKDNLESFEMLSVLRIMFELGYVAKNDDIKMFLEDDKWSSDLLNEIFIKRNIVLAVINKAIKESQL
jgi:hypothetical protein